MLSSIANIVLATSTDTPPPLNPYLNGRKGPPIAPGVKIRLPIEPSPYEKHILMPELITPEHRTAMAAIAATTNEFTTPYISLDPLFVGASNTYNPSGKRIIIPDIVNKLQLNNGTNPKLFYTRGSRNIPVFSSLPIDRRTVGAGDFSTPV
jgi:hypothetical protein